MKNSAEFFTTINILIGDFFHHLLKKYLHSVLITAVRRYLTFLFIILSFQFIYIYFKNKARKIHENSKRAAMPCNTITQHMAKIKQGISA